MIKTIIICSLTIITMIIGIIFKPDIKIKKLSIQSFWVVSLIGAFLLIIFKSISLNEIKAVLFEKGPMNPIKILLLFISMSVLSIALDEVGFFSTCAYYATKYTKGNQKILFLSISIVVSVLTVFTSNDIVILTFTPFICYFARRTKINPIPYLIAEFIFANTWSMLFIIGNPTNIFLATNFGITFIDYAGTMLIPTIVTGIFGFLILLYIFRKPLAKEIISDEVLDKPYLDKIGAIIGLIHLTGCTIMLVISGYVDLEMWLISFVFAISMSLSYFIYYIIKKEKVLFSTYKRAPWNLIPFVISMFIIVTSLNNCGIVEEVASLMNKLAINKVSTIYGYGFSSFLTCNVINNIPMSVMFEKIISTSNKLYLKESIYSTIAASNLGAYFSPIGALAGIMWMSILKKMGLEFNFGKFMKYCSLIALLLIFICLSTLLMII